MAGGTSMSVGDYDPQYGDLVRQDIPSQGPVLPTDARTKDNHVQRDDRLIRLTGGHPFNSEAPLTLLYNQGFITPHQLHYVRNHGPVPNVSSEEAENWTVEVCGLVENPIRIGLKEIQSNFENITLPITLVCAGNRRKEQNIVRKTSGFSWGSAGISTSLWTGTLLKNLLQMVRPTREAKFVHFEGVDNLPSDHYGTCIGLSWAEDFHRAIMIAWKQNGLELSPDHGWPLRIIVPGVIGGRSVKWLRRITLASAPSENFYHIHDNRVLPTLVSPEIAKAEEKWWKDERYALYNLNIQSIIVYPQHNEVLRQTEGIYKIRGFAYNGGGVRIGRVEISLDRGRSWRLSTIRYPEDEYREKGIRELFGAKVDLEDRYLYFCWCFWELEVEIDTLIASKDILVRAMDDNMNRQPTEMYWSVLGMLSNCIFRVAVREDGNGGVKFEHPTNLKGNDGWMDRVKLSGGDLLGYMWGEEDSHSPVVKPALKVANEEVSMVQTEKLGIVISRTDLKRHANAESPWIVVNNQVYDCTPFLSEHPGGADSITMVAGEDATEDFMAIHSETAKSMFAKYHIGRLEDGANGCSSDSNIAADAVEPTKVSLTFLDPKKWKFVELLQKIDLSKDVRLFNFALDSTEQTSGLPVGKHVYIRLRTPKGQLVIRAYTPVSCHRTQGLLTLLIKVYFPTENIPGGVMGTALDALQPGDRIEVKGPLGSFSYLGRGAVEFRGKRSQAKTFYMVSGGSGITPCYQILKELAYDSEDETRAHLLFGNRQLEDIMCRDELEEFVNAAKSRIKVDYWLSQSPLPEGWTHNHGRIDSAILDSIIRERDESMLLVCGPDGMVQGVRDWAASSGYPQDQLVVF